MPYRVGTFYFDEVSGELWRGSQLVPGVSGQIIALLRLLVEYAGQLVSYTELRRRIWGRTVVSDDSISQCIYRARRALQHSRQSPVIEVVYGRGVRLLLPVAALSEPSQVELRRDSPPVLILPLQAREPELVELGDRLGEGIALILSSHWCVLDYGLSRCLSDRGWDAGELHARFGVGYLVAGRLERVSDSVRLTLRIVHSASRRTVARVGAEGDPADPAELALVLASRLSTGLGRLAIAAARRDRAGLATDHERMFLHHHKIASLLRPELASARNELDAMARSDVPPRDVHMNRALACRSADRSTRSRRSPAGRARSRSPASSSRTAATSSPHASRRSGTS
jgi:DNA-binding winged helix-turn-helix (wHTH) protein